MNSVTSDKSSSAYQEPSDVLKRLFLPPKNPSLSLSSDLQWLLFASEPPLPSIEVLARPEEKLAGVRFDPALWAPSRLDFAYGLTAQHLATGQRIEIPLPDRASEGIRYIRFNPNPSAVSCEQQFAFVSKTGGKNELVPYICNLTRDSNNSFRWTTSPLSGLAQYRLNCCNGCAYQFTCDGLTLLAKVVPQDHPLTPPEEPVSVGPSIQVVSKDARKAPGRTYQDLLQNPYDECKFRYFMTTELVAVDLREKEIGDRYDRASVLPQSVGGRLIQKITSSPSGRFLLLEITTRLSYAVPLKRFGREIEVWDLHGRAARTIRLWLLRFPSMMKFLSVTTPALAILETLPSTRAIRTRCCTRRQLTGEIPRIRQPQTENEMFCIPKKFGHCLTTMVAPLAH